MQRRNTRAKGKIETRDEAHVMIEWKPRDNPIGSILGQCFRKTPHLLRKHRARYHDALLCSCRTARELEKQRIVGEMLLTNGKGPVSRFGGKALHEHGFEPTAVRELPSRNRKTDPRPQILS